MLLLCIQVEQAAAQLRALVLERQSSAQRSLAAIWRHFDRAGTGSVTVPQFQAALADLRIDLTEQVGAYNENHITIT